MAGRRFEQCLNLLFAEFQNATSTRNAKVQHGNNASDRPAIPRYESENHSLKTGIKHPLYQVSFSLNHPSIDTQA